MLLISSDGCFLTLLLDALTHRSDATDFRVCDGSGQRPLQMPTVWLDPVVLPYQNLFINAVVSLKLHLTGEKTSTVTEQKDKSVQWTLGVLVFMHIYAHT